MALATVSRSLPPNQSSGPGLSALRQNGFTLMEMLIAVSITAVIGLGIWQVLSGVMTSRERVDAVSEDFEGLQKTFLLLERDLRQVVNRPVRNIYGDYEPAISSEGQEFELVVTRQGWRNPLGNARSSLQRSAWEFTGDEIRRRYWVMVDQGQEDESRDQLLLGEVTEFAVRFMDEDRNWQETWPPPNQGMPSGPGAPVLPLPRAVEVMVTHNRFGEVRRLFLMPDFNFGAVQTSISQRNQDAEAPEDEDESEEQGTNNTGNQGGGS